MNIICHVPETLATRLIKYILVKYFRWGLRHESGIITYASPAAVFFIIADVAVREAGAQPVNAVSSKVVLRMDREVVVVWLMGRSRTVVTLVRGRMMS